MRSDDPAKEQVRVAVHATAFELLLVETCLHIRHLQGTTLESTEKGADSGG